MQGLRTRLRSGLHISRPTWRHHPGVRSGNQLTRGERAADALRNGMGSWAFVFFALVFLCGWMLGNRNVGFDKYPFILLNLVLSCLAALQGSILLIAAKREDQINSELARHDYETNREADAIVKQIHALAREIHACTVPQAGDGSSARTRRDEGPWCRPDAGIDDGVMTHTLTVGYDGSPQATRALMWAADVAARDDAVLRIVACFTSPGLVDPWYLAIPVDIEQIRAAAERDMATAVERVRAAHPDVRVDPQVVWGRPRTELVERAAGSDLLVVGTTGAGVAESLFLGSVAHAVARSSPCPVVLVPAVPPVAPKGRVVVGVDGSPAPDRALEWAVHEADRRDAELQVVHAWQYEYAQEDTAAEGRDFLRVDAARVLDRAAERARELARGPVTDQLVEAQAADALVNAVVDADLVVLGTRGRGSVRAALFGSVAQAVAGRSSRPTVVVRDVPPA